MVKGLKILNPADKARREARKKELKKNKKQRQQVRSAAIESRDPEQVIADLEKLDRLEYDIATNPTMSDSFYKDKRKRLKEKWSKILLYYAKEDPERHAKLKKLESDYESKHYKLSKEFDSIKAAQEVKIEDIFLPPESNSAIDEITDDDPLLSESVYVTPLTEGINPPGCPPGLPPDFKQLVDSLFAPVSLDQQQLISNPLNLQLSRTSMVEPAMRGTNPSHRQKQKTEIDLKRADRQNFRQPQQARNDPVSEIKMATGTTKTTIIESKPVIFKPRVTKFIPSSLRSKIVRDDTKD